MNDIMKVIFIGDHFYEESGSIMSSIYIRPPHRYRGNIDAYMRTDWGQVQIALREGKEVQITQATEIERLRFTNKLVAVNKEWKEGRVPS